MRFPEHSITIITELKKNHISIFVLAQCCIVLTFFLDFFFELTESYYEIAYKFKLYSSDILCFMSYLSINPLNDKIQSFM